MGAIFISYRRKDSAGYAGRLCDRLSEVFGAKNVFMDVEDIHPGEDFAQAIEDRIAACAVVIAVVGPQWLPILKDRLAAKDDFVEHEIASALKRNVRVIPVLVGGATMPEVSDLPEPLAPFSRHQAVVLSDTGFSNDLARLIAAIRELPGMTVPTPFLRRPVFWFAAFALLVAALGILYFAWPRPQSIDGIWIAQMQRGNLRPYRIRLALTTDGPTVTGKVEYPTGTGIIEDGRLNGRHLTFFTRHTPQFEDNPVTIRCNGTLDGADIRLICTYPGASAAGIAHRAPR